MKYKEAMQGLPNQLITKPVNGKVHHTALVSPRGEARSEIETEAEGETDGSQKTSKVENNFLKLLEGLTGIKNKQNETSQDILLDGKKINIGSLIKNQNKEGDSQNLEFSDDSDESVIVTTPSILSALTSVQIPQGGESEILSNKSISKTTGNVDKFVNKTTSNLEELINCLKNKDIVIEDQDSETGNQSQIVSTKKENISELKNKSPIDFIINSKKTENLSNNSGENTFKKGDVLNGHKVIITGDDYLKKAGLSEKKDSEKMILIKTLEGPKNQNIKGYGQQAMLSSEPLIKNGKELSLKNTQLSKTLKLDDVKTKENSDAQGIKQDFIPMLQNKDGKSQQAETQSQANQKILDLGKINTSNTTEIIKRISDYIEQNNVANKSSLDLTVKHESLGEFKIQVSKMPSQSINQSSNSLDMQITTSSQEGQDFFVKNEVSLIKNLNNAGINLSDFRIVNTMTNSLDSGHTDSKQSNSQNGSDFNDKQFMSFESDTSANDSSNGKGKRKELWEEYQQRYGA